MALSIKAILPMGKRVVLGSSPFPTKQKLKHIGNKLT